MRKKRKQYNGKEKVVIIRKHLLEGVAVSDVCEEYGIQPSVFYRWQKTFFEQGSVVFERGADNQVSRQQREIAALKEKLQKKLLKPDFRMLSIFFRKPSLKSIMKQKTLYGNGMPGTTLFRNLTAQSPITALWRNTRN